MRTTLDIDDDILAAVSGLASEQNTTAGKVISDLARKALTHPADRAESKYHNGLRLMQRTEGIVTPEMIDQLSEDDV
ncbi:MAG TPA: CopG family transcriptional regulator [Xanthobacteraceae bacterium]|nr:CopG family transcriptional regulator [Xanthobacteraceae bacterium]